MKYLVILVLLLGMECKAQEKEFNEAIARGRSPKQFYCVTNPKGKSLTISKFIKYAESHNYIVGTYTSFSKDRFGEKVSVLSKFPFLPKDEYTKFIYEHVNASFPFSSLKVGNCLLYANGKFNKFKVLWSGNIENGMLNGNGTAFFFNESQTSFYFTNSEFQTGMPHGSTVLYASRVHENREIVEFTRISDFVVGDFYDGFASFRTNGKYGFITTNGNIAIQPNYERVIKNFSNGRAEVFSEGKEIVIGQNGSFIDFTAHQKALDQAEAEKKRQEELAKQEEERQKAIAREKERKERERQAALQEERRLKAIAELQPGDRIYWSGDYEKDEGFWFIFRMHDYKH